MMPSYAQAVFTGAAAEFLYDGSLVMADENTTFAMVADNSDIDAADATSDSTNYRHSPLLWAGQPNILAIARSFESAFLITLAVHTPVNQSPYLASHFAQSFDEEAHIRWSRFSETPTQPSTW